MADLSSLGRLLMAFGLGMLAIGAGISLLSRLTGSGWLPGDLVIRRGNVACVFPLVTSILLSVILTIILNLVIGFARR